MAKVYKQVRVVGCSPESYEEAVKAAIAKASESLHGLAWWEVVEMRGAIRDGRPVDWQVTLALSFAVD